MLAQEVIRLSNNTIERNKTNGSRTDLFNGSRYNSFIWIGKGAIYAPKYCAFND